MWGQLLVAASILLGADEIYMYPEAYEHGDGLGATVNEAALATLIQENTTDGGEEDGIPRVGHAIDLNNDGKAEIFLMPGRVAYGVGVGWYEIFTELDGKYVQIGGASIWFSLGKSRNGFARILHQINIGERTNPTYVVNVSYYDGEKYVAEHTTELSYGQMEQLGLDAYRRKDYEAAERRFLNVIHSGLGHHVRNENNLAAVLMRTDRNAQAIERLKAALKELDSMEETRPWNDRQRAEQLKHRANAEYNLGKAYEAMEDLSTAAKHYQAAYDLVPTEDRKATLERMAELGVSTAGFKILR